MKKIKIGSVGLGRLGLRHAENIAGKIENAELTALCDLNKDMLSKTADRLNVKHRFTDFSQMIKLEELDAVVIVSPSSLHTGQIASALD
ncbi:MAG: Gfo/Idh/MocA family oxidoreductase, partial [Spirochaetales bacterium]|nr:Gfo/Idh/MocA family oxidoreductase [Spirochaetales bacterium]